MPRVKCGQAIAAASIASRLLPRLPSQFQFRPWCWPASKRGNSTYPFVKALVAANDSGNVPGKKKEYWYGNRAIMHIHTWTDSSPDEFICIFLYDIWLGLSTTVTADIQIINLSNVASYLVRILSLLSSRWDWYSKLVLSHHKRLTRVVPVSMKSGDE